MGKNSNNVTIAQLPDAVAELLQNYVDEIADGTDEAADRVSKQCLSEIKSGSPVKTGKYQRGWTKKLTSNRRGQKGYTIYNKYPGMPHLLENGHAKVNGGRVPGTPHIAPAESKAVEEFQREVQEVVANAGG